MTLGTSNDESSQSGLDLVDEKKKNDHHRVVGNQSSHCSLPLALHDQRTAAGYVVSVFCLFATLSLSLLRVQAFPVIDIGRTQNYRSNTKLTPRIQREYSASRLQLNVMPLKSRGDAVSEDSVSDGIATNSTTGSNQLLLNFNASGSIGSLLMQMQKKEAELRELNQSASLLLSEDQALNLDPSSSSKTTNDASASSTTRNGLFSWIRKSDDEGMNAMANLDASVTDPTAMDDELARELDNSVSIRITNSIKDVILLEPPELYRSRPPTTAAETTTAVDDGTRATDSDDLPPLSRPEHYNDRIGRDMRHLAVSIASCIDSVEEWQLFCQQSTGGLEPLIDCIREGADSIRGSSPDDDESITDTTNTNTGFSRKEENFQAAMSACKALRDLSALSLDLAAVITDGLLRANVGYKARGEPTLMDDLCTILCHGDDLSDLLTGKARRRKKRRGIFGRRREEPTESVSPPQPQPQSTITSKWPMGIFRERREARLRCKLYVTQLLLAMTCASDCAVDAIRSTDGLQDVLLDYSSYARREQRRRWIRYPGEMVKSMWLKKRKKQQDVETSETTENGEPRRQPFIEAASLKNNLKGRIKGTANQVLAAIGYNEWVPKIPGQKGLRILCLDGGGSRGMTSVVAMKCLVDSLGGMEVADCFDLVVGTSTGAIIAFLVGLNRETSEQAVERYDVLIEKIFTKSAFSTPMLLFTTASYDESPFMNVLTNILKDNTMLDSRADPAVPLVFAVTSKMSSNPTHVALFRNYNYAGGELPDPFMVNPEDARENLDLPLQDEAKNIRMHDYPKKKDLTQPAPGTITPDNGSRHPGSFRVLQKYALRASTAAPTVFKPVLMGGEMYCDGGIVASNPSAIAIHEARTIFPDVPIELVVSIGTGGFKEQKSEPRIGWDGIIGQIINSATDGEQIHHILEDVLGDGTTAQGMSSVSNTSYMRFNPVLGMPDEFPIDVTDPEKLKQIKAITKAYMEDPEQQQKLQALSDILKGRSSNRVRKWFK